MQYRRGKKEKLTELALLYGKAKWRLFNTATTPCDSFATVFTFDDVMPSNRSLFHLRFVLLVVSASKLDDSPQHRNVSCNAKQFNVQIERLMFIIYHSSFIIWLDCSCLGCSVSWRKTKPSMIWPCHSFISYSILQLILKPALYLLIYLTYLYFWWWRLPIEVMQIIYI